MVDFCDVIINYDVQFGLQTFSYGWVANYSHVFNLVSLIFYKLSLLLDAKFSKFLQK